MPRVGSDAEQPGHQQQREAERKFRSKERELQEKLKETEKKLSDLQTKEQAGGATILSADQQKAIEDARKEILSLRRELRLVQNDLRKDIDAKRSHLLHRLWALDVRWGEPDEGRNSIGTFRETWVLQWEPELEMRLIDASTYGTTIAEAAAARIVERAQGATTLADVSACIEQAMLAAPAPKMAMAIG